jgi:hypothetical protein
MALIEEGHDLIAFLEACNASAGGQDPAPSEPGITLSFWGSE